MTGCGNCLDLNETVQIGLIFMKKIYILLLTSAIYVALYYGSVPYISEIFGVLFTSAVAGVLIAAGKEISKQTGSRRLILACYSIGALCLMVAIISLISNLLFYCNFELYRGMFY